MSKITNQDNMQNIKCPKCMKSQFVLDYDGKTNYFEYEYLGQQRLTKRISKDVDFFCYVCDHQFKMKKGWKKGQVLDALTVDVDFSEYEYNIKYVSKKQGRKPVAWIEIFNGNSNTYFCKVWGLDLVERIEENDFSKGSVWTAEIRLESNKKDSSKGTSFMALHFNWDSVNMRDDV